MTDDVEPMRPEEYRSGLIVRIVIGVVLMTGGVLLVILGVDLPEKEILGMEWTEEIALLAIVGSCAGVSSYVVRSQKRVAAWRELRAAYGDGEPLGNGPSGPPASFKPDGEQ